MDEKEKRKIEKRIMIGSFLLLLCAAGYLLYSAFVLKRIGPEYNVIIFGCLLLFWVLTDVVSVICTKGFEGKTEVQKKAYWMYAVMDLAGLAGLGYFAVSMSNNGGMIGALIYAFTMMGKRKYKDEYMGITEKEDEEEDAPEELADGEAQETDSPEELTDKEAQETDALEELADGEAQETEEEN